MPEPIVLPYVPQQRQWLLHNAKCRQIFYGGAAGGGKSTSIRWDAIQFCLENPGCQAYLFRRTLNELQKNHIRWAQIDLPVNLGLGRYSEGRNAYEFYNGSVLYMCYCERSADVETYQGTEMHWTGLDEASQFTDYQIGYLKTRNRLGSWKPKVRDGRLPRFVMGSNPGGVGHTYLKSLFIDSAEPETVFYDKTMRDPDDPDDKGWTSIFIPAKISDNAFIDKDYRASFGGLPPEAARALREGDWDAVVGQALHNLSRDRHMLRPFAPPRHWTRIMGMDWGTAAPFSIGWYTVSEGAILSARDGYPERWLPEGSLIRYAEWYGWDGRPNKGCRKDARSVAREILRLEEERHDYVDYRVGDSSMWAETDGPSVSENMFDATGGRFVMQRAKKDRKHNYSEVLCRLAGDPEYRESGEEETHPMLFATADCRHFWRTMPPMVLDDIDPEKGPDDKQENHVYDEVAYVCRSRPYATTEQDRYLVAHAEEIREAMKVSVDPYATA